MAQQCEVIDMMYVLLSITPKALRRLIATALFAAHA